MQRLLEAEDTAEDGRLYDAEIDEFDVALAVSVMARMAERVVAGNNYTLCYSFVLSFFSDKDYLFG